MIEVRIFATLRQGRDKVTLLSPEGIACAGDILDRMNIPQEEVSILLINGFHHKPESEVKDGAAGRRGRPSRTGGDGRAPARRHLAGTLP